MTDVDIDPEAVAQAMTVEAVKARIVALTLRSLDHAEELLEDGTPQVKMQVMRSVIPTLVKSLAKDEQDAELAELRAQMVELRKDIMRAGTIEATASPTPEDVEGDEPDLRIAPPMPTDEG